MSREKDKDLEAGRAVPSGMSSDLSDDQPARVVISWSENDKENPYNWPTVCSLDSLRDKT